MKLSWWQKYLIGQALGKKEGQRGWIVIKILENWPKNANFDMNDPASMILSFKAAFEAVSAIFSASRAAKVSIDEDDDATKW